MTIKKAEADFLAHATAQQEARLNQPEALGRTSAGRSQLKKLSLG
jgi:hypothetical protein